ncbi:MAG: hypothetical protein JXR96_16480 [Deltaproteobacteria bacterium]|nr:hypothetical protein [Deltaproteobacteria bacterium]
MTEPSRAALETDRSKPGRGRVIAVKTGSNPNSSSLGVNVTLLLAGGAAASLLCLLAGSLVRWVTGRKGDSGGDGAQSDGGGEG